MIGSELPTIYEGKQDPPNECSRDLTSSQAGKPKGRSTTRRPFGFTADPEKLIHAVMTTGSAVLEAAARSCFLVGLSLVKVPLQFLAE